MRAPAGQPQTDDRRKDGPWATGASSRRRLALAVTPLFAVYRLAFLGRTPAPVRGGGLAVDLDVLIYQPVSVRVTASYSAHRLQDAYTIDGDNPPKLSARGGTLHTLDFGGAVVFAMDLGRARPLLEAGIGGMMVRTPDAVQDGQRGGVCLDGGGCDVGLACAKSENICRQSVIPRLHAGAGIEVFLSDRWTVGASIRYYALLLAPTVFPVYLQAGLRVGVRF
jgi:opacity protein-like surface antigen